MRTSVSVIIPTFNNAQYISAAIHSVLRQTYSPQEVVVVDNNSTDNTTQVVLSIGDPRVKYLRCDSPGIISAVRNYGVANSAGEFLAFLDSDDEWLPEKLALQIQHLTDPKVVCVSTNYEAMGDVVHTKRHLHFSASETYRDYKYREVVLGNPVMTSSVLVRREDFDRVGRFDEDPRFRFIEDWELWLRLCSEGCVRVLADRLIRYRVMVKKNRDRRAIARNTFEIFSKHGRLGLLTEQMQTVARANASISAGRAYLEVNDPLGRQYYFTGLRSSLGWRNKFRAAGGLAVYAFPRAWRGLIIEAYYRVRPSDR